MKQNLKKLKMPHKMEAQDDKDLEMALSEPSSEDDSGGEDLFPSSGMEEEGGEAEGSEGEESRAEDLAHLSDEDLMGEMAKRGLLRKMEMEEGEPSAEEDAQKMEKKYMPMKSKLQ